MPIREEPSQNPGNELFGYFDNLLDVNLSGLVDGAYVRYDAASQSWLPVTGILPAPSTLDTLTDVVVGTPSVHQLIAYDGANWINSGYLLNSLFDVDTSSASASGRALIWNGSFWIAGHPTGAAASVGSVALDDLTDAVITSATVHQTLAYNGANWINSGTLLNSLFDVDTTSASASGRALIWNGSFWIAGHPTGAGVGGVATLDDLTDTVISTATTHQILSYNGSNWINSGYLINSLADVDTTSASASGRALIWNGSTWIAGHPTGAGAGGVTTLAALTDVALTNVVHGHGLVYDGSTSKFINAHAIFAPTGLSTDISANNAPIITNFLNTYGYCYIPSGLYHISTHITMGANNLRLFGHGTLMGKSGFVNDQMIHMAATGCTVEDILLNGIHCPGNAGGINMGGRNNTIRNVTISNTKYHGVFMPGVNSRVDQCRIYTCGLSGAVGIKANGRINYVTNTLIDGWYGKGLVADHQKSLGEYSALFVDNCYLRTNTGVLTPSGIESCLLVDVGEGNPSYSLVSLTNSVFEFEQVAEGSDSEFNTNVVKFATVDNVKMDNCSVVALVTGINLIDGLHIAEKVANITIENCVISPNIGYETATNRVSDSLVVRNTQIGGIYPLHDNYRPLYQLRARHIHIDNCYLGSSGTNIAIYTDHDDIQMLRVENCRIHGNYDSNFIGLTWNTGTQEYNSRRMVFKNNLITNSGAGAIFTAGNPALRLLYNTVDDEGSVWRTACPTDPNNLSQIDKISFIRGDRIINSGASAPGEALEWVCISGGRPAKWECAGRIEPRITGYYDVTHYGVTNTGGNVTLALRTMLNNVPNNSMVKFPAGIYYITGTVRLNQKVNIEIDAQGAEFREIPYQIVSGHAFPMCSGMFYFNYCTGITFYGGVVSGAANMNELYSLSSGLVCSGYSSSAYGNWANDGQEARNVIPTTFNFEQCSDMIFDKWNVRNKYRFAVTYRCLDMFFSHNHFHCVITGISYRNQIITTIGPSGNEVQIGDMHKLAARQTFMFNIVKGRNVVITDTHSNNCGGMLSAGSSSLGGGQGPSISEQIQIRGCTMRNSYDNHVYFSSTHKSTVSDSLGWNDETLNHICGGMKGRGSYIVFDNCQVHNVHYGFGLEGLSNDEDYWTDFAAPGWTSEGSKIINCTVNGAGNAGIFLDPNEDNTAFPRDILIQGNYLYNCALGPYGRAPTGWISGDGYENAVITAPDGYRTRILNNVIENTGSLGPNQAIYIGQQRTTMWISGCEIAGNTFLGCKVGIRAVYLSDARIYNNYAERLGRNNAPFIEQSGASALIVTENIKDSRIYDNVLAPTGHAYGIWTIPGSTFTNIRRRDNDGIEVIN